MRPSARCEAAESRRRRVVGADGGVHNAGVLAARGKITWWMWAAVALCAAGPFLPSINNELALDDKLIIAQNPRIDDPGDVRAIWLTDWWFAAGTAALSPDRDLLYRPVVLQVFSVIHHFAGTNSVPYHVLNILCHVLTSLLAMVLGAWLFGSAALAFVAALIFAVHPGHAEAVISLVGMTDVMSAMFLVGGLLCVMWWRTAQSGLARLMLPIAATLCFLLSMLSKESGIAFVALVPICLWRAGKKRESRGNLPDVREVSPAEPHDSANSAETEEAEPSRMPAFLRSATFWIASSAIVLGAYLPLRYAALGNRLEQPIPPSPMSNVLVIAHGAERVWTRLAIFAEYLRLAFWPAKLSCDYSYDAVPIARSASDPRVLLALGVIAAWLVLLVIWTRRDRSMLVATLFFAALYALPSNALIVFRTMVGERLLYLPLLPLLWVSLLPAFAIARGVARRGLPGHTGAVLAAGAVLIVVLPAATHTMTRARDWSSEALLYITDAATFPRCARLQLKRAVVLGQRGAWDECGAGIDRALEIAPNYVEAHVERMHYLLRFGRLSEGWDEFAYLTRTLGPTPPFVADEIAARRVHVLALIPPTPASAPESIPASPSETDPIVQAAIRAGDLETAAGRLIDIANANPNDVNARMLLGAVFILMRQPEDAKNVYETIVAEDHDNAEAVAVLGILVTLQDPALGARMLAHAATIAPHDELIQFGAACVFYFAGDPSASLSKMLELANSLPPGHPMRKLVVRLLPPDAPITASG